MARQRGGGVVVDFPGGFTTAHPSRLRGVGVFGFVGCNKISNARFILGHAPCVDFPRAGVRYTQRIGLIQLCQ